MKQWIKLDTSLLTDHRIKRLLENFGMKGFGVYVSILLMAESDRNMTEGMIVAAFKHQCGRNIIQKVLNDFELFQVDEDNFLRAAMHADMHAPMHAPMHAAMHTDMHAAMHAPVSFNDKEREENKNKSCSSINDHHDNRPFSKPSFLDVSRYCEEHDYSINIKKFYTYYESKGWKVGRYVTDDWKALVDNWAIRDLEKACAKNDSYDETAYINDEY